MVRHNQVRWCDNSGSVQGSTWERADYAEINFNLLAVMLLNSPLASIEPEELPTY